MNIKQQIHISKKSAFTLVEVVVAISIMVLVVAATTSIFVHGLKAWHEQTIENQLHVNLEKAIEWIRYDLRLSSMSIGASMAFYPTNSTEYTAISMPVAEDTDNDGLFERNDLGELLWDQTVIYHVREGTPWELVRTTFSPKSTNATPSQIYEQLKKVVAGDKQSAALTGETYESRVIFQNLVNMTFRPIPTLYDGYAPATTLEKDFNFGSIMLGGGDHTVTLKLEGKNAAAAADYLGIDKFSLSASDSAREGEHYFDGIGYGYYTYTNIGGLVATQSMSSSLWSGGNQLLFKPIALNAQLSLNVHNDLWLDSEFDTVDGTMRINSTIISNDYATMQRGTAWNVFDVTGATTNYNEGGFIDSNIVVWLYGEQLANNPSFDHIRLNGNAVRVLFAGPTGITNNQLKIVSAGIINAGATNINARLKFGGADSTSISANTEKWSDWVTFPLHYDRYADLDAAGSDHANTSYKIWFRVGSPANKAWLRTWDGPNTNTMGSVNGVPTEKVYAVKEVEVAYPAKAWFASGLFDTQIPDPNYTLLNFSVTNEGANCDVDVRIGTTDDRLGLTDFQWWPLAGYYENGVNNNISGAQNGRYVKYEAEFAADEGPVSSPPSPYDEASHLYHMMIEWNPPVGIVDLNMDLCKGPNFGIYSATVNGQVLARGIEVELIIFEDSLAERRHETSGSMKIVPLNTGK